MPRVKRGTVRRAKRKKLLGLAKGYYARKSKLYRSAKEAVDTALKYAFVGRRDKKRSFRRLWIVRILFRPISLQAVRSLPVPVFPGPGNCRGAALSSLCRPGGPGPR